MDPISPTKTCLGYDGGIKIKIDFIVINKIVRGIISLFLIFLIIILPLSFKICVCIFAFPIVLFLILMPVLAKIVMDRVWQVIK